MFQDTSTEEGMLVFARDLPFESRGLALIFIFKAV